MQPKVVRLIDRAPVACDDAKDLIDWLLNWAGQLDEDKNLRSLVLIVETDAGELFKVSQSTQQMDGARIQGLLSLIAHRLADGRGQYDNR